MKVTRKSPLTGEINTMELPCVPAQFVAWQTGMTIQDAFPNLTPGEREFVKTGITPMEWDKVFLDGEEE